MTMIEKEKTILCILVVKFNTCTILKITTYCNISPNIRIHSIQLETQNDFLSIEYLKLTKN